MTAKTSDYLSALLDKLKPEEWRSFSDTVRLFNVVESEGYTHKDHTHAYITFCLALKGVCDCRETWIKDHTFAETNDALVKAITDCMVKGDLWEPRSPAPAVPSPCPARAARGFSCHRSAPKHWRSLSVARSTGRSG